MNRELEDKDNKIKKFEDEYIRNMVISINLMMI